MAKFEDWADASTRSAGGRAVVSRNWSAPALLLVLTAGAAHAHSAGMGCCPMRGGMGGLGVGMMVLGALFLVALIAVLVALTVFLIRRSRPHWPTAP